MVSIKKKSFSRLELKHSSFKICLRVQQRFNVTTMVRIRKSHIENGLPCGSAGKESACNAGDLGLILGLDRSPGEGKGYPLQYSGLENSRDCIVHVIVKSLTRLSNFHFHFQILNVKLES